LSLGNSDNFNLQISLSERHVFHTAFQVFKIVKKISPPYLYKFFSLAVDVTGHSGRNQYRLLVLRVHTDYGERSLAYRGTTIWNRLSPALYRARTVIEFKRLYTGCCKFNFVLYVYVCYCCMFFFVPGH